MSDTKKNNEELVNELCELRQSNRDLRLLYEKEIFEKELEQKYIRESEEKYRFMFDENPLPSWIYNPDTLSFIEVNEAAINHYGYSRQELLLMTLKDIHPLEDIQNLLEDNKMINSQQNKVGEWRHIKKSGELTFVEIASHSVILKGVVVKHAIIHDITERKRTETDLFESEMNFRRSISESPVGIRIVTVDSKTIYANRTFLDIYELNNLDEYIKKSTVDLYTPESYKQHLERKKSRNKGQEVFEYEISFRCRNNEIRHVKVSRKEILWDGAKHYQVITVNITEQRNAEDELRKLSRVVEQSPNAICITNLDGIIEYVNPRAISLTGFSKDELVGSHTRIFSSRQKKIEEYAVLWETIKSGNIWSGEFLNVRKNGEFYWESAIISPILDNTGRVTHYLSIKEDVTESKRIHRDLIIAKEQVEKSEIFLRTFIENMPFEIWACNVDRVGILENKMHFDNYGTIIGKSLENTTVVCENNIQVWECNMERLMNGEVIDEECEVNQQQKIFQKIAFPIYKKEEIIGIAGLNVNITDRKLAENALINSETQLKKFVSHLQNVRDEERNVLALEIHDDLGQILVALKIDTGLLKQSLIKNDTFICPENILQKFNNLVDLIDNTIRTTRRIMNGLRYEQLELLGLEVAIKEYLCEFENRYQLKCKFVSTISKLEINEQQSMACFRILQEALTNIVKHARATLVEIDLTNFDGKLRMEIVDNGIGFDKKNSGRNDSYGMIGMQERVFLLNGELTILSSVGQGTRVRVEMPI